jgi:hypothetical protein
VRRRLPNFFVVGTLKAGTTSLFHYLKQHPQIYMSPVKEPGYFASEVRPECYSEAVRKKLLDQKREAFAQLEKGPPSALPDCLVTDWNEYTKLFVFADQKVAIGEASTLYLWSRTAADNIRNELPHARIIMMLRDPAERAFSQYLNELADAGIRIPFRKHLEQCSFAHGPDFDVRHPFLEVGLYHEQVKRYLETFPQNQIRIFWYEDDWADTTGSPMPTTT